MVNARFGSRFQDDSILFAKRSDERITVQTDALFTGDFDDLSYRFGASASDSPLDFTHLPLSGDAFVASAMVTTDAAASSVFAGPPADTNVSIDAAQPIGDNAPPVSHAASLPGNIVVYRIGSGVSALNSSAAAVFLDEYTPAGVLVQSIPMPTADNGANQMLTASGSATSEGLLTRSADGRYLILTGYDAAVGTASVATTATTAVQRVVGRVDAAGNIDTSTTLGTAFSGNGIRSAASIDGSAFWVAGGSSGVAYASLGQTSSTIISSTFTNLRGMTIYDGQLYTSAQTGTLRLGAVGTGTPTTGGETITNLPGIPTGVLSPHQFFFADLSAAVAGVDTLYVTDDRALGSGGGIYKYSLVGGTWTQTGAVAIGAGSVRGLVGSVNGTSVSFYATTTQATSNFIVTFTDSSGYNAPMTGLSFTLLAQAATNTVFRGIALAPVAPSPGSLSINDVTQAEGNSGTTNFTFTVTRSGGSSGAVSATWALSHGTSDNADFTAFPQTGTVSFADGETSKTITITVAGDTDFESNDTFFVDLSAPTGGATIADAQGLGTITNDDTANTPPVGNADSYSVNEDGILNVNALSGVLANDTDSDSDPLTVTLGTSVTHGTLLLNSDGSFDYTPDANYYGPDSFTYFVSDGTTNSGPITVSLTVDPVNDGPKGFADDYSVNEDDTLTVSTILGVLVNDTDPENDMLTATLVTGPTNGTLVLNPNGSFTYTPFANFNGTDSFTYSASDGGASTDPITVTLTVNSVNDAPYGADGSINFYEDNLLILNDPAFFGFGDSDGNSFAGVWIDSYTGNGSFTLNGGALTTPTFVSAGQIASGQLVFTPAPNANGNNYAEFTYRVVDDGGTLNGGSDTGATNTRVINVLAQNDTPQGVADAYSIDEDGVLTVGLASGVLANDTDADGDALIATLGSNVAHGTLVLNADGSFTYTPNANYNGTDSFTYTVSDGIATSGPVTVTLTVNPMGEILPPGQLAPFGDEFRVNSYTGGDQRYSSITALEGGGFVVTWSSDLQDGSSWGIYGQRYTAAGVADGAEFRVNSYISSSQIYPTIAALEGGGFVVTWSSAGQDGSSAGIYGQRYSAAGVADGSEFRINSYTASQQNQPSVAALDGGGFVVTWSSTGQDGSGDGIYAQRYTAAGVADGAEFRVNSFTSSEQTHPSVASLNGGGFVVTWMSYSQDGSDWGIYAQRYTAAGVPDGGEFRINSQTVDSQIYPSVATLHDGGFVVTWSSNSQDGEGWGIYAQRYTAAGIADGGEFRINSYTANNQIYASVVALEGGGFVVTWSSNGQDGSGWGVYGQRYDAAGVADGGEFLINQTTNADQFQDLFTLQGITQLADGTLVAAWQGNGPGDSYGIFARHIGLAPVNIAPTVDLNGANAGIDNSVAYTEGGGRVMLAPDVAVGDVDSATLTGATVTIANGFDSADSLRINVGASGIIANYNSSTGVLTLSGAASASAYQSVLATLSFKSGSENPASTRDIIVTVTDGTNSSIAGHITIAVTPVNDAPVNVVPGAQSGTSGSPIIFSTGNGNALSVTDPDAGSSAIKVKIYVEHGTLILSGMNGLTVRGNGSNVVVLQGSMADINAALNGLSYQPTAGYTGSDTLTIGTDDRAGNGTGGVLTDIDTVAITINSGVPTALPAPQIDILDDGAGSNIAGAFIGKEHAEGPGGHLDIANHAFQTGPDLSALTVFLG